jgi:adenine-specific DNA-methyltransferase
MKQKIPNTEGIKYAGSKLKLLPYILSLTDNLKVDTILDGFSGTTRVSQAFAKNGYKVIANDISEWSYIFGVAYLKNKEQPHYYQELIDYLNSLEGYEGWYSQHYGGVVYENGSAIQKDGTKKPWQLHNTKKLDAIRDKIEELKLDEVTKAVALTSLILALDEVDNTIGHYSSYLKSWSKRSYKQLKLRVPKVFINKRDNEVIQDDIFNICKKRVDFAYFDPPYGSNNEKMPPSRVRYQAYYHIWKTIVKHDKPELFGKVLRRKDSSDRFCQNPFEDFRKNEEGTFIALKAIEKLIKTTNAKYIALSYSSGGRATAEQLNEILNRYGKLIKTIAIDYKEHVMASMKWTNKWLKESNQKHKEFIFLIEK